MTKRDYNMTIADLKGKTINSFTGGKEGDDYVEFKTDDGYRFHFVHHQDCCESVSINDIVGDLNDLIGFPIVLAEESCNGDPNADESGTWTFYRFATIKGYVNIRWYGTSNGYYSESVDLDVWNDNA